MCVVLVGFEDLCDTKLVKNQFFAVWCVGVCLFTKSAGISPAERPWASFLSILPTGFLLKVYNEQFLPSEYFKISL